MQMFNCIEGRVNAGAEVRLKLHSHVQIQGHDKIDSRRHR